MIRIQRYLLPLLATLSLLSLAVCSDNQYTSVRSLDKFGNSVQIKNAQAAALQKGRLIVAACNGLDTIVVVSIGDRPVVHSLVLPVLESDGNSNEHVLAMCCSGIKGDANWLLSQVQRYVTSVWDRYNFAQLTSPALSHYVSSQMGSFQSYKVDNEWQSGIGRENDVDWARPLGIQTMILSLQDKDPNILIVEPSGRVMVTGDMKSIKSTSRQWHYACIGKDSDKIQQRLTQKEDQFVSENKDASVSKIVEGMIQLMLENSPKHEVTEFMVELVTRGEGIARNMSTYKNGKEVSSKAI